MVDSLDAGDFNVWILAQIHKLSRARYFWRSDHRQQPPSDSKKVDPALSHIEKIRECVDEIQRSNAE